jgi:hypothetical protein
MVDRGLDEFVSSFLGLEGAAFMEEKCPHGGDGTCIDFWKVCLLCHGRLQPIDTMDATTGTDCFVLIIPILVLRQM